jgi:predicted dinucleotide-binding enzyme
MSKIAVLGAGHVGTAIAAAAVDAGYEVDIAASGSPDRIRLIVDVLIPGARAVTAAEAVQGAEFVVIAVPLGKFRSIDPAILAGKTVIDVMNYWEPIDGSLPEFDDAPQGTSTIVQRHFLDARIVKSLNHLGYHELEWDRRPPGATDRRALAAAGNEPEAVAEVLAVLDQLGFDAIDAGQLANGVALQPGSPVFGAFPSRCARCSHPPVRRSSPSAGSAVSR